tara:strand:- start:432 stop:821 length:390 start_codon:yes stop_codon:yes gene_type:complete
MGLGLGISSATTGGGSTAVVTEDYLWSSVTAGEITPRFSSMLDAGHIRFTSDAWEGVQDGVHNQDLQPAIDSHPNYFSNDEGYWVVTEASNAYMSEVEDTTAGQDGDADTELTPIAIANIPIGDGNYIA